MGNYPSKTDVQEGFLDETIDITHETEGDPRSPSIDINRTPLQINMARSSESDNRDGPCQESIIEKCIHTFLLETMYECGKECLPIPSCLAFCPLPTPAENGVMKQGVMTKPITKNVDLTKECFDKCNETPINPALRALMNQMDPRSPALDFQRTPLAFIIKNHQLILKHNEKTDHFLDESDLQSNETLDNSNTGIITALAPKNLCEDLGNISVASDFIQEVVNTETSAEDFIQKVVNTETSAEAKCIFEDKSKSVEVISSNENSTPKLGLLETNLDYLETNLDTVRRRHKIIIKAKNDVELESLNVPIDAAPVALKADIKTDLSENDPRSPSVGIDRTPILVTENKTDNKILKSNKKTNSQMKEVFKNNVKLQKKKLSDEKFQEKDSIRKITDSLLIYEDVFPNIESPALNPKRANIHSGEGARTPLACMINIDKSRPNSKQNTPSNENIFDFNIKIDKSANLKSKIPVRVSKGSPPITLRSSDMKSMMARRIVPLDSENTPPQPRKACWDTDNSVVL